MKNLYKFTIIIPIYNSEKWLGDAIRSVINQSIGVENIQLILIDDGSSDNSLKISKEFKKQYPNNVLVISKTNGGVASARNLALKYAEGEYVGFLDSDDNISLNSLQTVYSFFEKNYPEIDLVSIPINYFDARIGPHYLNKKFEFGSRIINLDEEPQSIMVHITPNFIKRTIIEKYSFDEDLVTCEDSKVVAQLLLENNKFGVVDECKYNYRMRSGEKTSLSQIAKNNKKWYFDQLIDYPLWLVEYSYRIKRVIPEFVQYILACHLQWRFKYDIDEITFLTNDEKSLYKKMLKLSLKYIDDKILDEMTQITEKSKKYMKKIKYI